MIYGLARHIDSNVSSLSRGTNLFCMFKPESYTEDCVVLTETAGEVVDEWATDKVIKHVQILAQYKDYLTGQQILKTIKELLHGKATFDLPSRDPSVYYYEVESCTQVNGPIHLEFDQDRRHTFTLNMRFHLRKVTL